jgi:Xylose isomerase-like TIM barrel
MFELNRLAINQVTTRSWSVPEAIAGYARAGVRGIGLWPAAAREYSIANTRCALVEHGVVASSYCYGSMFVATDKVDLAKQRERNRKLIEEAAELSARCLVCVSGGPPPSEKNLETARQRTLEELAALLPIARRRSYHRHRAHSPDESRGRIVAHDPCRSQRALRRVRERTRNRGGYLPRMVGSVPLARTVTGKANASSDFIFQIGLAHLKEILPGAQ